jgi:hypothetical protein
MTLDIATWWRRISTKRGHPRTIAPEREIPSFEHILPSAEVLLSYAATAGISLNDADVKILTDEIAKHETAAHDNSGDHDYAIIIPAYTRVAKAILPVTAITLCECTVDARDTLRYNAKLAAISVIVVLSLSFFAFVSSSMSDSIKSDINTANTKIITLRSYLGSPGDPPPAAALPTYSEQDELTDLQQLAISSRSVYDRAKQLHRLIFFSFIWEPSELQKANDATVSKEANDKSPRNQVTCGEGNNFQMRGLFEYNPQLKHPYNDDFSHIVCGYQSVRVYAEELREFVTFWFGGVTASILPVLYSLLGAAAWSLRQTQIKIRAKTFHSADTKSAQYLVAAIAGTVISLFNGLFISSGLSLSPLAWAFLAGYSSDVLFRVLDGVMRPHVRDEPNSPS